MFKKILVANRGEIALRVISARREIGIRTVAVYSEADRDALHVRYADEDVCIGPYPPSASYLNVASIVSAAEITEADAIHPGYGFLSENSRFAEILADCRIAFIGPSPEAIRTMGDKALARKTMARAGVPTLPGSSGALETLDEAVELARKIGYPVILKASAGGGGRGMRVAQHERDLAAFYDRPRRGRKGVRNAESISRSTSAPRHIEFQASATGPAAWFISENASARSSAATRSSSRSRRPRRRRRAGGTDGRGGHPGGPVQVVSRGRTIEFLLDSDGQFYFMEMNTRIQVEHPVTSGDRHRPRERADLRRRGTAPVASEKQIKPRGHAIEFRINAEDPEKFTPSPGRISVFHQPGGIGVRVDTAAYQGYVIPPHYDSMIGKLIVHGKDRAEAIARGRRALDFFVIEGVKTTIPLHRRILEEKDFQEGRITTRFMERFASAGK
jgi:acetyl-CoA carboxylase biotin carboxylase subunit